MKKEKTQNVKMKGIVGAMLFIHVVVLMVKMEKHFSLDMSEESGVLRIQLPSPLTKPKKQIVASEDAERKEKKKNKEAFLSDQQRFFERETVARQNGSFKAGSVQKNSQRGKASPKVNLSDLGMKEFVPQKKKENPGGTVSQTNDYVEEMTLGDFTRLNTVEFKHYGFYHRIRQKLEQFWGKSLQEKSELLFQAGRSIASKNHLTSLKVVLNEKGDIVQVQITSPSGVKELDDAAVESFNQAGPFPNPPKELIRENKVVLEWGFVVKS